jgi:predicted transposase/invertase (TIGR01784 family)
MPIKNPHDKLFKQTFSLVSQVTVFLEEFLPKDLLNRLNLKTLEIENVSFITGKLQEYFSDIIYSCHFKTGKKARIIFLLEHKSYADANLSLQLLRYLTEAYDSQLNKQEYNKIDVHIPIVIYHGEEKWKKKTLIDLFNLPDSSFGAFVPTFDYLVVDLRTVTDNYLDRLERGYLIYGAFLLFKHKNDKQYFLQNFQKVFIFEKHKISEYDRKLFAESLINYINAIFKFSKKEVMTFQEMIEEAIEDQAYLPGSMIDQVITAQRRLKEAKGKITLLNSIDVLLSLFRNVPTWSDIKCAEISKATVKNTKALRKIMSENTQKKATKLILKTFFSKYLLTDEDKKEIEKLVVNFYSKE